MNSHEIDVDVLAIIRSCRPVATAVVQSAVIDPEMSANPFATGSTFSPAPPRL